MTSYLWNINSNNDQIICFIFKFQICDILIQHISEHYRCFVSHFNILIGKLYKWVCVCKHYRNIKCCLYLICNHVLWCGPVQHKIAYGSSDLECSKETLDSKDHGAIMGPTWVLSAPDEPHIGPMNLAIRDAIYHLHKAQHSAIVSKSIPLRRHSTD